MTRDLAEVILEACHKEELDCELFEDYSGRCMYGKKTTGISGDVTIVDILAAVIANADLFVLDGEAIFCSEELRQDQLGLGNIVY
jgi:hypothetical protein